MLRSILDELELNKRCFEVFDMREGDFVYDVYVTEHMPGQGGKKVIVNMEEVTEDGDTVLFDFEPDMTERPEALTYLLGFRNDFND